MSSDHLATSRTWLTELRTVQRWIEAHPVLMAASAILLPSISVYHYTMTEHVPLTMTSPDIIAALPSVLAAISFLTVILCAMPLLPILIMFDGAMREGSSELRLLPRKLAQRRGQLRLWMLALSIPGIALAIAVGASVKWFKNTNWLIPVAIALSSILFAVLVQKIKGKLIRDFFSETTAFALAVSCIQILLALLVMKATLRALGQDANDWLVFGAFLLSAPLLALIQMASITLVELTSVHAGFVRQTFVAAFSLVALACVLPTTGSALAGAVIQGSASGNHTCVLLKLSNDEKNFDDLLADPASVRLTVNLRILANADDIFFARRANEPSGAVHRIPADIVNSLVPCPSDRDKPVD